jgi:hypothetical protein
MLIGANAFGDVPLRERVARLGYLAGPPLQLVEDRRRDPDRELLRRESHRITK